jgi:hypothetical protein
VVILRRETEVEVGGRERKKVEKREEREIKKYNKRWK